MPEDLTAPQLPSVNLDAEPFKFGTSEIEDGFALELVKQSFFDFENYRRVNHDPRWNGNDALYCGYVPQKTWEGTKIPKASHSQMLAFEQIETALPIVDQAVFGTNAEWFQTEPEPGGDPNEARAVKDALLYTLDHDHDDFGRTARREIKMATKSILSYGNGGVIVYWDPTKKRPCVEWVDIRDIYIDPGTPTPSVDDSRSLIWRKHYTVQQLWDMRDQPGMNIPDKAILNNFSKSGIQDVGDQTKNIQESFRGVNWQPGQSDYSANPADRKIEVLVYYSKDRIIWVLNRQWVAFNNPNPYKFIQFCIAPCFTFLSRFYGLGYPDVLEGSQRYSEALYNARLNELSLAINPPRVKKAGSLMTPAQERYYPGATFQVNGMGDVRQDMVFQQPPAATANIMGDISFILGNADKITGINGPLGGNFEPGNVNRTKGGVDAQVSGASSRIYEIIKNIEDYLIVPMLYKLYKLIQFHTDPKDLLPILGPEGQKMQVGAKAFQSPMQFRMVAASRMLSRDKLLSILPVINQYFMNGAFLQQLHSAGKTVDFDEFQHLIQDATATARQYKLIRPLTPPEQQAINQPPPQAQMQMQQKQADLQNRVQLQQMKGQQAVQVETIKKSPDAADQQKMQMEQAKSAQDMQNEQVRAALEQRSTAAQMDQSAQADHQKTLLTMLGKHSEMAAKARQHRQSAAHKEQEHHQSLRHAEAQNAEKIRMQRVLMALKEQEAMQPPAPVAQ